MRSLALKVVVPLSLTLPMLLPATTELRGDVVSPASGPSDVAAPAAGAAGEGWSIERARILFAARRGERRELYVLDRDKASITALTDAGSEGAGANAGRVSPDGRRVAFQTVTGRDYEIHLMDLAGGVSVNLTRHPEFDVGPVWSPDGTRIAFMSTRGFELGGTGPFPGHVYTMDLHGEGMRQVTVEPLTSSLGPSDWSPDGRALLMARVHDERPDLYLLEVETGRETRLTETPGIGEYSAVFSRDGDRVAFHAETADSAQIAVMDLDGGNRRDLTSGPGWRYYPRWSPDDRWILFAASDDGEQYDLRAVRVEDGQVIDLVVTPEDEREGEWLP